MFKKTRIRIMALIMGSLILLFGTGLSIIVYESYRQVRNANSERLERYMNLYFLESQESIYKPSGPEPGEPEPRHQPAVQPPAEESPDFRLSTFYSVCFSNSGEVLKTDEGREGVYTGEELEELARRVLETNKSRGQTGSLMFSVSRRPDYTLVAFIDITLAESNLSTLLGNSISGGIASIVVLFFIALYISGRIVKPLEENDRKQKQFISDAGHELKTPIAVTGANAEMLAREIGENEWLANIQYENNRMGALVTQLLDLSRVENTQNPMEKTNLSDVVSGETLAFESLAFEAGKTIESIIEPDIYINGYISQLQQLVSILTDNAIRHSTGSRIEISLKKHSHSAVLTVSNPADEIPLDKMEHIFDRFYRVDQARSGEGRHYGLGLSIARAVALRHKGDIGASFSNGRMVFTVTLPL